MSALFRADIFHKTENTIYLFFTENSIAEIDKTYLKLSYEYKITKINFRNNIEV